MRIHNTVIWTFVYIYVVYLAKLSESSGILVESRAGTRNTDNDYNGLQIYTLDDSGSTVKNNSSKYKIIQLRANNVLVFNFNDNAKCTIVKHNDKDVWTIDTGDTPLLPNGQKEYPRKVSFNNSNVIFVYFKEKTLGYLLMKGEWRFMMKGDSLNVIEQHKIPILVITGPSGSGKTTLNTRLINDYSDIFENSVSCTTRAPREGEQDGVNYYFITMDEFNQKINNNEFLEHAEYAGNKYGTLKSELNRIRAENKIPVLEIDIQGCRSLRNQGMGMKNLFIDPGDLNVLRQRLVDRGGLTEEKINSRIERAEKEIEEAKKFPFHYTLKNDSDIDTVYYTFIDKLKEWYPDHNLKHKIPILVITGPSGSGKTTLNTRLINDYSDIFENSVSCTTRDPRSGEQEGVNYYFITKDEFNQKIENNEFLEHAEYAGNKYGTLKSELQRIRAENKIPVLEIDIQGCRSLRNQGMGMKNLFIDPGDLNVLRQRLVDRGGLTEEKINSRIERAEKEIEEAKKFPFHYTLKNDSDIDTVYYTFIDKLKEWYPDHNLKHKIPILVITGPSGSGKTTLNTRLINDYSDIFENSVSCTTRDPRSGEQEGVNYYFITKDEFNQKIENNEFLEHAEYAGNKYGTLKSELQRIRAENKIPVLEIDIQGCRSLRNQGMGMKNLFIDPGDLNVLRQRLVDRGGLTEEKINSRIERAEKEIEEAKKFPFHYTLKNDSDIDTVYYTFIDKLKEWYPDHNLKHKIPILVITGPSGSGKTTLNTRLINDYSDIFENSVSCTTRDPRSGEQEGVNYYFITKDEFNQKIENNEFLEHAEYAGNKYGTLKSELQRIRAENKIPVLEIDIQGCRSLRNQGMGMKNLFIDPGDLNVLRQRLVDRGGLTEEKINSRIERAEKEIEEAKKFPFHYTLKNDSDIDTVYYTFIDKLKEWYPDHNLKHKIPILVITGPSGSGKTTLNTRLINDYSDIFENSVSCTTRDPRSGEQDGVNYYFITKDEFNQKIENNEFLEHAEYAGNKYGTLKSELQRIRAENKIPVLEIDIQGCRSLRNQGMGMKNLFIDPGDLNVLRQRLVDRGGLTEEKINSRIERAEKEIKEAKNFGFDYTLENKDDIDTVYSTLIDKLKEWFEPLKTKLSSQQATL